LKPTLVTFYSVLHSKKNLLKILKYSHSGCWTWRWWWWREKEGKEKGRGEEGEEEGGGQQQNPVKGKTQNN